MPYFTQDIFDLSNSLLEGDGHSAAAFDGMTYNQAWRTIRAPTNGIDAGAHPVPP